MDTRRSTARIFGLLSLVLFLRSCDNDPYAPVPANSNPASFSAAAPPSLLVPIALAGGSISIWPYTGVDFSGTPQDPINLVFTGKSDPRSIRSALMSLNGDRTAYGMAPVYPFNCTWSDAMGDLQTGYNAEAAWVGSAIQLACGGYGPIRFHVRLFEAGAVALGKSHFQGPIPGPAHPPGF